MNFKNLFIVIIFICLCLVVIKDYSHLLWWKPRKHEYGVLTEDVVLYGYDHTDVV